MKAEIRSTFITQHMEVETRTDDGIEVVQAFLTIIDLDEGMSVTNDIERVLCTLHGADELRPGMRVIYRDTEGTWDEVVINGQCEFVGFRSLGGERDRDAALSRAVSMRHYQ